MVLTTLRKFKEKKKYNFLPVWLVDFLGFCCLFAFQGTLSYTALRESSPHLYSWTLLFKTVKWKR